MSDPISISKTLSIRECDLDEYWLQDQIFKNPSIIGLGELEALQREKKQSKGGRLDILLKNPETDSMYEVEVMLGATDESHIIRTIEYWELEKRRWPQRQHFAVIVAETITRRFFNVIQLLSLSIPIIAIQANIIEADGNRILHFTKVLDVYEEPEEEISSSDGVIYDRGWWHANAPWNVVNAENVQKLISTVIKQTQLNYVKNYISISIGRDIYFSFRKRSGGKSLLRIWMNNSSLSKSKSLLDEKSIPYSVMPYDNEGQLLQFIVDQKLIESDSDLFLEIAALVKTSWGSDL